MTALVRGLAVREANVTGKLGQRQVHHSRAGERGGRRAMDDVSMGRSQERGRRNARWSTAEGTDTVAFVGALTHREAATGCARPSTRKMASGVYLRAACSRPLSRNSLGPTASKNAHRSKEIVESIVGWSVAVQSKAANGIYLWEADQQSLRLTVAVRTVVHPGIRSPPLREAPCEARKSVHPASLVDQPLVSSDFGGRHTIRCIRVALESRSGRRENDCVAGTASLPGVALAERRGRTLLGSSEARGC